MAFDGRTVVTDADRAAAKAMLEHAFRHVSTRALKDVDFADIVAAFATHAAQAHAAGLEEAAKVADAIAGDCILSGESSEYADHRSDWLCRSWGASRSCSAIRARITTTGGGAALAPASSEGEG